MVLGNIQQLYQSNSSGERNLAVLMNTEQRIAVFNDEAHNTPAAEYDNTLFTLKQISKFRLDTTATPDRADGKAPDSKMIFEYGITDAQSEVPPIIKSVVVYQPKLASVELTYTNTETGEKRTVDEMDQEFERIEKGLSSTQWVTDPDPMRKQMQIAIQRLNEQKNRAEWLGKNTYKPILFVVAITIKDAEQARDMLKELGLKTLLVTEQSDEDDRQAARLLGKPDSEYEAVVSVLMLREGWDVPRYQVILLLRKFSSRVYGQQVIGRGLRLNMRGEDAQEICAVVDHEKLNQGGCGIWSGRKSIRTLTNSQVWRRGLAAETETAVVAKPGILIEIPKPARRRTDFDKDLDNIVIEIGDYPTGRIFGWLQLLRRNRNHRGRNRECRGAHAGRSGFMELHEPPGPYGVGKNAEAASPMELAESLKNSSARYCRRFVGGRRYWLARERLSLRRSDGSREQENAGWKTVGAASVEVLRPWNRRSSYGSQSKARRDW